MAKLVSNVYAEAFFELALEENAIDQYETEAKLVLDVLRAEVDFQAIIKHPRISEAKKFDMLKNILSDKVSEHFLGLLNLIITKNRESYLEEILENYLNEVLVHKGILVAKVITPAELNEKQQSKLKAELTKKLGKEIILKLIIDESLIAGLKIIVDGYIIDGSLKARIKDMKNTLYAIPS